MKAVSDPRKAKELSRAEILLLRKKEQLRQRRMRKGFFIAALCILAAVILYPLTALLFRSRFLPRTEINGISMGGKTAEEAEELLKAAVEGYSLTITLRGGKQEVIQGSEIALTYASSNETAQLLSSQNSAAWLPSLFGRASSYSVETGFRYDSAKLRERLGAFPDFQKDHVVKTQDASLVQDEDHIFHIRTQVLGNEPDPDIICEKAESAVLHGSSHLDLNRTEGAYRSPSVLESSETLQQQRDLLNDFLSSSVTIRYKDGTVDVLDRNTLSSWIDYTKEEGYTLSNETLYTNAYLLMHAAAGKYDDVRTSIDFNSTAEGTIRLECEPYGYQIDVEKGMDRIVEALRGHETVEIEPENMLEETIDPSFGGTYCEIDITGQHIWYYESGELVLDSDCVTGLESDPDRRTPSGLFYLYNKERDAVLGSNDPSEPYEVVVDCWMPFFESYGMHDARWREDFGGDIYEYSGSHGCANMPPEMAHELFERIEIGTPVIVLRYGDGMSGEET